MNRNDKKLKIAVAGVKIDNFCRCVEKSFINSKKRFKFTTGLDN